MPRPPVEDVIQQQVRLARHWWREARIARHGEWADVAVFLEQRARFHLGVARKIRRIGVTFEGYAHR